MAGKQAKLHLPLPITPLSLALPPPPPSTPSYLWKNCLIRNQSLGSKVLGTTALKDLAYTLRDEEDPGTLES